MSRPGSRAGSGKKKKEKPKPPKVIIKELTEQNEQLTTELEQLKVEAEQMRVKIQLVTQKIIEGTNKKDLFRLYRVDDNSNIMLLTPDVLLDMLEKMIVKKDIKEQSVESRVEELETRVTTMSLDIAKMAAKTMAYENGIRQINKSFDIEEIKDKLMDLTLLAGQEYNIFTTHDPTYTQNHFPAILECNGVEEKKETAARRILHSAREYNLVPPAQTSPGETHISNMHKDLRLFLMKELSIEKSSGADWRMLAERVGIHPDDVAYWHSLKLDCPMGRVFGAWGVSESATMRMLHRHLMSPQMRCTLLGRRIADFYNVEYG